MKMSCPNETSNKKGEPFPGHECVTEQTRRGMSLVCSRIQLQTTKEGGNLIAYRRQNNKKIKKTARPVNEHHPPVPKFWRDVPPEIAILKNIF